MNFLAHAVLLNDPPEALLGNLIADHVKGRGGEFPLGVQHGIAIHRLIDDLTDAHPATVRTRALLAPRWGLYSRVLVDVFFDHIIATDWASYSAEPSEAFRARSYANLERVVHLAPLSARHFFSRMVAEDWFASYATEEGIHRALSRMTMRAKRLPRPLEDAMPELFAQKNVIGGHLREAFPDIRAAVAASQLAAGPPTSQG